MNKETSERADLLALWGGRIPIGIHTGSSPWGSYIFL